MSDHAFFACQNIGALVVPTFNRKRLHAGFNPRNHEFPLDSVLNARVAAMPAPPDVPKTDEELDAEEGLAAPPAHPAYGADDAEGGGRGARGRGVGRGGRGKGRGKGFKRNLDERPSGSRPKAKAKGRFRRGVL